MDLKLIVLAGAKEGTQIPLKKDKFIIGRASECTLRAGSSAISRRHCAIVRKDGAWLVRDLGSRNGTFLNDSAVETPTPLQVGDELRVGPLHFRVEQLTANAESSKVSKPAAGAQASQPAEAVVAHDVKRGKQRPVKDVSDVARRTARLPDDSASEEDISRWLLGMDGGSDTGGDSLRETQTLSLEETTTIGRAAPPQETASNNGTAVEEPTEESAEGTPEETGDESGSGGWKFFKLGKKGAAKKSPGKLPPRPAEVSKDSREAAADILREMTRRR